MTNIDSSRQLLSNIYFANCVDHKAIRNLRYDKRKHPTKHTARLLRYLNVFSFDLTFKSEKEMLVNYTLSWLKIEKKSNICNVIYLNFLQRLPTKLT